MIRRRPLVSRLVWIALLAFRPHALRAEAAVPSPTSAPGRAERVVIMVWDGLRPDGVTDADTPTLARMAREGVNFTRHHPVYPSTTEVNGTAMATGCYPGHSGLIGNAEFRPAINPRKAVATEALETIRRGDHLTRGKYLLVPTLPELFRAVGWRTAVAGTKPVAMLWDRDERPEPAATRPGDVTLFAGKALPPGMAATVEATLGAPFPVALQLPNTDANRWTRRALLEALWKDGPPKLSVLWMSDPDYTQHQFGPSSPQARRALAADDANLAAVLAALDAGHWRDTTDVFVVSDHGFSTIKTPVETAERLKAAGFAAARELKKPLSPGNVLVDGLGGAVFLYVGGHDAETIRRLVEFFQRSEFAGVILTRDAVPGTFALSTLHLDSPEAPDVVVTMRWTDEKNAHGLPGQIFVDVNHNWPASSTHPLPRVKGQGNHGTLSRFDMHNTLIASGPDLRPGFRDELPSSNADLAPTITHLFGLPHPPPMDGRILSEALTCPGEPDAPIPHTEILSAGRGNIPSPGANWLQTLQITRCGGETYFDEGNADPVGPVVGPSPLAP